jgi:hypothetical protein
MYKKLGVETAENWYRHIPKAVREHEDIIAEWNEGVEADSGH